MMLEYAKHLNYLAILVAALANFAIGAIWYTPKVMGSRWMKLNNIVPDDTKKVNMGKVMGLAFVGTLLTSFGLSFIVYNAGWVVGVASGAIVGVCIVTANHLKHNMFLMRPMELTFLDGAHDVLCFIAMGAILSVWP